MYEVEFSSCFLTLNSQKANSMMKQENVTSTSIVKLASLLF